MIVFDEAHEYVGCKGLVRELENAVTQIRHDGLSFIPASQFPEHIPESIFKYLLTRLMFKLPSGTSVDFVRRAVPNLECLWSQQLSNLELEQGLCYLQTDDDCTDALLRVPQLLSIRPRCAGHGGGNDEEPALGGTARAQPCHVYTKATQHRSGDGKVPRQPTGAAAPRQSSSLFPNGRLPSPPWVDVGQVIPHTGAPRGPTCGLVDGLHGPTGAARTFSTARVQRLLGAGSANLQALVMRFRECCGGPPVAWPPFGRNETRGFLPGYVMEEACWRHTPNSPNSLAQRCKRLVPPDL
ncbi:MAG: hypothetical protein K6T86_06800 [Pirellulales bacterium]|nr:hypothetical protein [Pirellulales bacterium]